MTRMRRFDAHCESVGAARRFARETLGECAPGTLDAVELMVSELATNCVRHAESDFSVKIEVAGGGLRVEARDSGGGRPAPRSPAPTEPSGRGLRIVEALSDSWGVIPAVNGKTVWFELEFELELEGERAEPSGGARELTPR